MKTCLNIIGAIALLIGIGSCCIYFVAAGTADINTEDDIDRVGSVTAPFLGLSAFAFLVAIGVGISVRQINRRERDQKEERRHQEQLHAMYQMSKSSVPPPQNPDDMLIERAKLLYQQGDIEGCKALLRTMPFNPKAQKALMRIENH